MTDKIYCRYRGFCEWYNYNYSFIAYCSHKSNGYISQRKLCADTTHVKIVKKIQIYYTNRDIIVNFVGNDVESATLATLCVYIHVHCDQ